MTLEIRSESENGPQIRASRTLLEASQKEPRPYLITILAEKYIVLPGAFSPKYFDSMEIFAREFPFRRERSFLEVGSGTGIMCVLAAQSGSSTVLGVDLNPVSVQNTRLNAELHGLEKCISAQLSDIFSSVSPGAKFDTIYWNLPFIYVSEDFEFKSIEEYALFDPGYRAAERFIRNARRFLSSNGRVILGFGDFGDATRLSRICSDNGWRPRLLASAEGLEGGKVEFQLLQLEAEQTIDSITASP